MILGTRYAIEPDFALLREEAMDRKAIPRAEDVLWAIEVSDATLAKDLGRKKRAYAEAAVPHYWVFDTQRKGTWLFSRPEGDTYAEERFAPAGESLAMPVLGGLLDTGPLFPAA